ncbi:MAG: hypothetical protein KAT32_02575 [Candidatus Moranbacteria bacterium]|nr:hypothetical protein [Candidatus Moranbacteria bacterium]
MISCPNWLKRKVTYDTKSINPSFNNGHVKFSMGIIAFHEGHSDAPLVERQMNIFLKSIYRKHISSNWNLTHTGIEQKRIDLTSAIKEIEEELSKKYSYNLSWLQMGVFDKSQRGYKMFIIYPNGGEWINGAIYNFNC